MPSIPTTIFAEAWRLQWLALRADCTRRGTIAGAQAQNFAPWIQGTDPGASLLPAAGEMHQEWAPEGTSG